MPIYVYETIPERAETPVQRFEIWQRMTDEPLKFHPETGEPVRRIIIGGIGAPESIIDTSSLRKRTSR
jgi:predicted nucleic acid-binding Zn ribbon protein